MVAATSEWDTPSRAAALWRACKVAVHVLLRAWANLGPRAPRRAQRGTRWVAAPTVAEHTSPLWTDGRPEEFMLVAGKVHNLRLAVRAFDGVELPAGASLSFWRQLGRASRRRGFVEGREIIGGCVVPTVGGGLCQLSNALAACARQAGLDVLERHSHSARAEATVALTDGDATVAWNYIDLRLRTAFDLRIEATLTAQTLCVRLRASAAAQPSPQRQPKSRVLPIRAPAAPAPVARGCLTCDETACFRHRAQPALQSALQSATQAGRHAVLVDALPPELLSSLGAAAASADWFMPWLRPKRRAAALQPPAGVLVQRARWASWRRMARGRVLRGEGGRRQAAVLDGAAILGEAFAAALRPQHVSLTVSQDVLVPLWRAGALGGRAFDVHLTQLPASELQRQLDAAAARQPQAGSLSDFRVGAAWMADEWAALRAARHRSTAHQAVADALAGVGLSVQRLPWQLPPAARWSTPAGPSTLVLPASALARKGVLELAEVARQLQCRVCVLGSPSSDPGLWRGVQVEHIGWGHGWLARAHAVVLPAHVEHRPRALLLALASGVPVVATPACGLPAQPGLHLVPAGDAQALAAAVAEVLRICRQMS